MHFCGVICSNWSIRIESLSGTVIYYDVATISEIENEAGTRTKTKEWFGNDPDTCDSEGTRRCYNDAKERVCAF